MPSIKMLKRLWTYHRKRTEASFRGFREFSKREVPHQEHVFLGHDPELRSRPVTITNSFCSESRRLTPYRFTPYVIKFLSQTRQIH
jgi:hypothetical protein